MNYIGSAASPRFLVLRSWFLEPHHGHGYEHCGCGAVAGVHDDYLEQATARAGEKHEGADGQEYAHRGEQGGDFDYYQKKS